MEPAEYTSWFRANRASLPGRSPFHHPAWLEAISRGTGFDVRVIGIVDGTEVTGAVPGFFTQRGPFRLFGSPLRGTMTSYLGPVTLDAAPTYDEARGLVVDCAAFVKGRWNARYAQFTLRDAPEERRPMPSTGWHEQRPKSYRLDLTDGEDAVFARLKSKCRRNIRKAAREGVTIVPFDDPALFHSILGETFRRHGSSSRHPKRFFEAIMRTLPAHDLLHAWAAEYEGRVIAVGLFLYDDQEMHYLSGASLPEYGSLPTSYLLHWHAMATAARAGLSVFNSEASRVPSIDAFKESFNPVLDRRSTLIYAPGALWTARRSFVTWTKAMRRVRSGDVVRRVNSRRSVGAEAKEPVSST
jgi:Acetyltransferase (GNAT) domain